MKKSIVIILVVFVAVINSVAQSLVTEWSTNVGGSASEVNGFFMDGKASLGVDLDGNVIMVTGSLSTDGMITNSKGGEDCFIVKYASDGTEMWSKSFGGSGDDRPRKLISLANGDFLIAGYTNSNDGDLTNHHGGTDGYTDGFLSRFDKDGALLWSKQYGGADFASIPGRDYIYSCLEKSDGNIVAVGTTTSQNGDLPPDWMTSTPSFKVGWFLEVNGSDGSVITSKRVKSSSHNEFNENTVEDIVYLSDGTGYCALGYQGYGLNGIHWVTKLNASGDMDWDIEVGNINGLFVYEASIVETYDDNVMVALVTGDGSTANYNGGVTDMWTVKLDASNGSVLTEMSFGGSDSDMPYKLLPDEHGKYYLAGCSGSTDGFAHGGSTSFDNFIIYMDESFDTLWTQRFGGTGDDRVTDLAVDNAGNLFVAGRSESSDVFYTNNYGGRDAWIGKFTNLMYDGVEEREIAPSVKVYPNPILGNMICFDLKELKSTYIKVELYDLKGRLLLSQNSNTSSGKVDISSLNLDNGLYLIKFINDKKIITNKISINK